MADIKWIKVAVDMFEDNKIEFIRSMPEGDAIIVIWIQMLSIAGQSNMGGYLMVTEGIPYTEQLLSNKLRRQPVLLQFALETLSKLKMIDIEDGPYHITKWEKHQNIEGMEKVRALTNDRVKKHRSKEKEKFVTLQSNATETLQVTHCNAIEVELELDKEKSSSTADFFDKVRISYNEIHKVVDMPMQDSPMLTRLLSDGIPPELIIGVMKDKYKHGVKTIKYYVEAIRERFEETKPKQQKIDPQILARRREIAFGRWIDSGGNPDEFIYNAPTGA